MEQEIGTVADQVFLRWTNDWSEQEFSQDGQKLNGLFEKDQIGVRLSIDSLRTTVTPYYGSVPVKSEPVKQALSLLTAAIGEDVEEHEVFPAKYKQIVPCS